MKRERNAAKRTAAATKSAARRALIAEQAAIKAEAIAEEQAPAIQRQTIADSDGVVIREPLAVPDVKRGGYRRNSVVRQLHATSPNEITAKHVHAAERLLNDYDIGIEGATGGGMREAVDGATSIDISEARLRAIQSYRDAMRALGASLGGIVAVVVIENWPVTRVAQSIGVHRDRAFGRIAAGLQRLVEHYHPPREVATIRPAEDAARAAADPDPQDVPAERLGRWRGSQGRERAVQFGT
jgi:hypothetical protein